MDFCPDWTVTASCTKNISVQLIFRNFACLIWFNTVVSADGDWFASKLAFMKILIRYVLEWGENFIALKLSCSCCNIHGHVLSTYINPTKFSISLLQCLTHMYCQYWHVYSLPGAVCTEDNGLWFVFWQDTHSDFQILLHVVFTNYPKPDHLIKSVHCNIARLSST